MEAAHQHDRQADDRLAIGMRLSQRGQRDLAQVEVQRAHHAAESAGDLRHLFEVEAHAIGGDASVLQRDGMRIRCEGSAEGEHDLKNLSRCAGEVEVRSTEGEGARSPTEASPADTQVSHGGPQHAHPPFHGDLSRSAGGALRPWDRYPRRNACGTSRSGRAAAAAYTHFFEVNRPPMMRFSFTAASPSFTRLVIPFRIGTPSSVS